MRTAAAIAIAAGLTAAAHAQMPLFDVEVYYNFLPSARNLDGVIAGATRPVFWGNETATVLDVQGKEHVFDDPAIAYSFMQHVAADGTAFGAGWSATQDKLIVFDGAWSTHNFPAEIHSDVLDGNDAGEIIIWSRVPSIPTNPTHAFVWQGSSWLDLGSLRADPNAWTAVNPHDINNEGVIVGAAGTDFTSQQGGLYSHAFRYTPGVGMEDLGTLKGDLANSAAYGLNEQGDIVGASQDEGSLAWQATLWTADGDIIRLSPEGTYQSVAEIITEDGAVFGWLEIVDGVQLKRHAFRWTDNDGFVDLGTTETFFLGFESVNADGVAVGSDMTEVYEQHAVAYYPGVGLIPISEAVADVEDVDMLTVGVSIHDDGSILAAGMHTNERFLMTDRSVTLTPAAGCNADYNGDGKLNILDFVAFQNAFKNGDADCDGDGAHTILDFVCFQTLFSAGCI